MRAWLFLLTFCALFALGQGAARAASPVAEAAVTVGALPSWVRRIEPDLGGKAADGATSDGSYLLLSDVQRRFGDASEAYIHRARRLETTTAVENFSEITIELRPAFERLVFHAVRIRRGGQSIDALKREQIKVFENESDLDAKMLHGTATAHIVLHDVRVGDVIETELTFVGANPVFGGAILGSFDLAYHEPIHRLHRRLLFPAARNVVHKVFGSTAAATVSTEGSERALEWDRVAVPALVREDMMPRGYDPSAWVEWTEHATWKDVVTWATPMYTPSVPDAALRERIDAIRASATDRESQLLAALRLVQTEIRYLGIELGTSSHRPELSSVVFKRRFGDCKDKAMLLVTMLRALGIEADPAFVNTRSRAEIDGFLPSPLAFDHVIVRARIDDKTYWLDGTNSIEGGALDVREAPPFARALVVNATTTGLTPIPRTRPSAPLTTVEESYVVTDFAGPVKLDVHTLYRAHRADGWRDQLASEPRAEIERIFLNFYAKTDPDVKQVAAPTFADDPKANVFTVDEHYQLPTFWRNGERYFEPYALEDGISRPKIVLRTMPLAVPYPIRAEHVTRITFPAPYESTPEHRVLEDDTLRFESDVRADGNTVTIRYALETRRDTVPAAEVSAYLKMLDRIEHALRWGVDQRARPAPPPPPKEFPKGIYPFIALVGVWGAWVVGRGMFDRLRQARRRRSLAPQKGETAATAVLVRSDTEVEQHLQHARCSCGARWSEMSTERLWSEASFEGRRLSAVRTSCPSCGEWTRCWFDRAS